MRNYCLFVQDRLKFNKFVLTLLMVMGYFSERQQFRFRFAHIYIKIKIYEAGVNS